MTRRLLGWVGTSALLLFVVTMLTFVLTAIAPGDAARAILGQHGTEEQYLALRAQLGLDRPVMERYLDWLGSALRGDLGTSLFSHEPVTRIIGLRLPVTFSLVLLSLLLVTLVGIVLGIVSARASRIAGPVVDVVSLVGMALPNFWLGFVLVAMFAVAIPIFPATGYVPLAPDPGAWLMSLALPVFTLSVAGIAIVSKQTRDSMASELRRPYIEVLRAQGVGEGSVVLRHALRNAAIPIATVLGLVFSGAFSGTVLVENVFALPGLGGLVVQATQARDIPVVQALALFFALMVVLSNLLVDVAYGWLNPKVRHA